jgi:RES domain-containing protein
MNLSACPHLVRSPENQTWYRAIQLQHVSTALQTHQTRLLPSRFNGGPLASSPFRVLYLAENHLVALFEARAVVGSITGYPGVVPVPSRAWTVLNVRVRLSEVADLTDPVEQARLETSAQGLTGDWQGYQQRGQSGTILAPSGLAPTQELGAALEALPVLEAFRTVSALVPNHRVLVVFPDKLAPTSSVQWQDPTTGQWHFVP